jgi:hypothetical protein
MVIFDFQAVFIFLDFEKHLPPPRRREFRGRFAPLVHGRLRAGKHYRITKSGRN